MPPMTRAETYDELAQLEQLLDEYARCEALDPAKLPALRRAASGSCCTTPSCTATWSVDGEQPDARRLRRRSSSTSTATCASSRTLQIRDGLHVLGARARGRAVVDRAGAICAWAGRRAVLRAAVAAELGRRSRGAGDGVDASTAVDALPGPRPRRRPRRPAATSHGAHRRRAARGSHAGRGRGRRRGARTRRRRDDRAALRGERGRADAAGAPPTRSTNLLARPATARHVPAGPSRRRPPAGGSTCCRPGATSTRSTRKALPSRPRLDVGRRAGRRAAAPPPRRDGAHPETVGIVVWGTAAMRTAGRRRRPRSSRCSACGRVGTPETRRVVGLEADPAGGARPARGSTSPCASRASSATPSRTSSTLLDDAVALVAGARRAGRANFVRKHVLADVERAGGRLAARDRAHLRRGARAPTARASCSSLESGNWRDDADLAEVYEAWGGHAYGRGLDGVAGARRRCAASSPRIDVAVKNQSTTASTTCFDSSDYFAEHGGMIAYVRHARRRATRRP